MRAIVMREDKLLCVRLKPYKEIATGDYWCLPGGKLEPGEALVPALEREMVEETGVAPHIGALLYIQQFTYNGTDHLEFFFHVTNANDYLNIDLDATTHGALEIAEIDFVDPVATTILPKFLRTEALAEHIVATTGPKIFSFVE